MGEGAPASTLTFRAAGESDVALVVAITRAAFAETARFSHPSSVLRESVSDLRSFLTEGHALLGVNDKDRVVAVCRWTADERAMSFSRLAVLPSERGQGHASALVAQLEAHARTLGLHETRCSARSSMPDNRPFYLTRGYTIDGYEDVYGVPQLRTNMRKTL